MQSFMFQWRLGHIPALYKATAFSTLRKRYEEQLHTLMQYFKDAFTIMYNLLHLVNTTLIKEVQVPMIGAKLEYMDFLISEWIADNKSCLNRRSKHLKCSF